MSPLFLYTMSLNSCSCIDYSEGCGLHHNSKVRCCFHLHMHIVLTGTRIVHSMLLHCSSVQSHYPMIVTSNILVIIMP